ncbi:hypothetical protein AAFF_G00104420 [Aldrovandia affinis]|uniref:Uncharacterized protein n=1 Tax=Aldrovandia affinis TaxID=143900 RepID=A0AAD7WXN9_9TELE|nr:hypothetical protein AAFF_G00104420 [Aldrovandia affinis]
MSPSPFKVDFHLWSWILRLLHRGQRRVGGLMQHSDRTVKADQPLRPGAQIKGSVTLSVSAEASAHMPCPVFTKNPPLRPTPAGCSIRVAAS